VFLAGSQGKRALALLVAASFLLLQASVLVAQPRAPYPDMPSGVSSYLLVADMSNQSAYTTTATSRSRHRMASDHSLDFAEYGVSICEAAEISCEGLKNNLRQHTAENPPIAPESRFDVVSRK
jgi:hypothetical protein